MEYSDKSGPTTLRQRLSWAADHVFIFFYSDPSPPTRFEPEQYVQRTQSTTAVALVTSLSPNGKSTWSRLSINKLETLCGSGKIKKKTELISTIYR